jgi:hypothetical protein
MVSGIPRLGNGQNLRIRYTISDLLLADNLLIPSPTSMNDRLSTLNKLGYNVPFNTNYSDMDPDIPPLTGYDTVALEQLYSDLKVRFGYVFEFYCSFGKIKIEANNTLVAANPWIAESDIIITDVNAYHVGNLSYNARATRFDNEIATVMNGSVKVLIDELSLKTSGDTFLGEDHRLFMDGTTYDSTQSIAIGQMYQNQLILLGGFYQYPSMNIISDAPSCTFAADTSGNMRYVVFNTMTTVVDVQSLILEIFGSGFNGNDTVIEINFGGTGWIDANNPYNGTSAFCLDELLSFYVRRLTFGLIKKSGIVWVKIGIKPSSGDVKISGVKVTAN